MNEFELEFQYRSIIYQIMVQSELKIFKLNLEHIKLNEPVSLGFFLST